MVNPAARRARSAASHVQLSSS